MHEYIIRACIYIIHTTPFLLVLGDKVRQAFFKFPAKLDVCNLLLSFVKYLHFSK